MESKKHNKTPKLTDTENRLVVGKKGVGKMGEEGQKVPTSSYKINKPWDVLYSMGTIINNTVLHI